jgi:DNA-binding transcriptional MerR regulator
MFLYLYFYYFKTIKYILRAIYFFFLFIKYNMDTKSYISPNKITKKYDVTSGTLRRWSESGKIRFLRPNGGKRIYHIDDINKMFSNTKANTNNDLESIKENIKQLENFDSIEDLENEIKKISEMISIVKDKSEE